MLSFSQSIFYKVLGFQHYSETTIRCLNRTSGGIVGFYSETGLERLEKVLASVGFRPVDTMMRVSVSE